MWVCSADVPEKPDNPYSACGIKITRERSDVPLCSFPWPGRQVLLLAFPCLPTCCKCLVTLQGKAANGLRLGGSLVLAADYSRNLPRNLYPRLAAGGTWVRGGVGAWPQLLPLTLSSVPSTLAFGDLRVLRGGIRDGVLSSGEHERGSSGAVPTGRSPV